MLVIPLNAMGSQTGQDTPDLDLVVQLEDMNRHERIVHTTGARWKQQ